MECGLWSRPEAAVRLCSWRSHLMHWPQTVSEWQSHQMAIPSGFPPPASSLRCPSGPSPNHRLALSPSPLSAGEDQTAAALLEDHPCPSSHTAIFSTPIFSWHGRVAFVNFWLPSWRPVAVMWGGICALWLLIHLHRFCTGASGVKYCGLLS